MRIVGKIFVVLTLLTSLVLLSFSISVSSWEPHWRDIARRPRSEVGPGKPLGLEHQLADVKAAVARQEYANDRIREEIVRADMDDPTSPYHHQIQALTTETDLLQVNNNDVRKELTLQTSNVRDMTTQAASIQTNLTKRVRDLKTLMVQLREELALSDDQLRRFVASHDTAQLNSTLYSQNERYRDRTTAEITRGTAALVAHGIDPESPPEGRAPRVRGVITSLGKRDLIELSIGADDGLQAGHTVELFRGHKYLGRARVVKTSPDKAVAEVLKEYQKARLQKGDLVATRLGIG